MRLGGLSAKYESKGDPATVSDDSGDDGGISYGIYQFPSTKGVVQKFVKWLLEQPYPYQNFSLPFPIQTTTNELKGLIYNK